jgi:hypothetical protein
MIKISFKTKKSRQTKSHGSDSSIIELRTLNVRGINQITKIWKKNYLKTKKKDDEIFKMVTTNKDDIVSDLFDKVCIENDANQLLLWIKMNKESIIVLTETKLKTKEDTFNFIKSVQWITKNKCWIYCNNLNETKHAKHGVITIIPKKYYLKPTHKNIKKGMITETILKNKLKPSNSFTLISYYNPNFSENPNLSKQILDKYNNQKKIIIAGDFNEMIDFKRDYHRIKGTIKMETIKNKTSKAKKFKENIKTNNFFYDINPSCYTHKTINDKEKIKETRIDWILYSSFFKNNTKTKHYVETPPINTDHKCLKQIFELPTNKQKKDFYKNKKRKFNIPDIAYENQIFIEELIKKFKTIKNLKIDANKKLKIMLDSTYQIYQKTKNLERKKKKKKLEEILDLNLRKKKKIRKMLKI